MGWIKYSVCEPHVRTACVVTFLLSFFVLSSVDCTCCSESQLQKVIAEVGAGRKHISSVLQAVHTLIQQWTPSVVYTHTVTKNTLVVLAVNTLIQQWPVLRSTPDWLQFNVECRPEAPSPLSFRLYPPSLSHLLPSHWPDGTAQGSITTFVAWLLLHTGSSRQSSFFLSFHIQWF